MIISFLVILVVFVTSFILTKFMREYCIKNEVMDIPNERSSHVHSTPRGGGVAIFLSSFLGMWFLYMLNLISIDFVLCLNFGGLIVSLTGWVDDIKGVSQKKRLLLYYCASIIVIIYTGIYLGSPFLEAELGASSLIRYFLISTALVWLINLYNFMDGTDAFAAIEAVTATFFCWAILSASNDIAIVSLVIFSASMGFLYWNFPPAKIFMGDAGSCFLGFSLGVVALYSDITNTMSYLVWFILLSVFIYDATFTLIMRIVLNKKWYMAHKSHAYQRLVVLGMNHKKLAYCLMLLNVIFIWPVAYMAYIYDEYMSTALAVNFIVLISIWASIQYFYKVKVYDK